MGIIDQWWQAKPPEEREAQGIAAYKGYARDDVLFAGYPGHASIYDFDGHAEHYSTTGDKLRAAYEQGKQEAEQEKAQDTALFYLRALLEKMEAGEEWYGTSFDEPHWLIEQAIAHMGK